MYQVKYTYLKVQNRNSCDGRKRNGGDGPNKVTHGMSDLHLGVSSKTPKERIDQRLGNVLLHLFRCHREVRMLVVVQENVPHHLVQHGEE